MIDLSKIQGMKIPDYSKEDLKKRLSKRDLLEFLIGVYGSEVMTRQIKFRAWHMPFGSDGPFQKMFYSQASSVLSFAEMNPDVYIVEQFTNLKDSKGQDIYEDDIIQLDPDDKPYRVFFDEGKFQIEGNGVVYELGEVYMDSEVVGNIFENPELLEDTK